MPTPRVLDDSRFSVAGRVAIVTGGGSGIGRAVAHVLARHGADVALAGRRVEQLKQTAADIEQQGVRALAVPTDVTEVAECKRLVEHVVAEFGRIDILVNCAGGMGGRATRPIEQWSVEDWFEIQNLNTSSVWFLSRFAAATMIERGSGAIVNVSSTSSFNGYPAGAPYAAAKAAVNNLTASMAGAWTPSGVRVNGVACGAVRTEPLVATSLRQFGDAEALGRYNAVGRIGEPEEIGHAVLFLASDASSYISGHTLVADGGRK